MDARCSGLQGTSTESGDVGTSLFGATAWVYPDESPLDGLKFLLQFEGEKPRAVFVEQGFVAQIIPMIRQALAAEGVRRWPYGRLRTAMKYQAA